MKAPSAPSNSHSTLATSRPCHQFSWTNCALTSSGQAMKNAAAAPTSRPKAQPPYIAVVPAALGSVRHSPSLSLSVPAGASALEGGAGVGGRGSPAVSISLISIAIRVVGVFFARILRALAEALVGPLIP